MEATLTEPLSFPSQSYAQSFFHSVPTDTRFLNCSFQKFLPSTSLDAETQQFNFSRFEAPNVYMIQDAVLEVRIAILKKDGNVPVIILQMS